MACYQRAVELCAALGASYYQADALSHLGDLHAAAGEQGPARASWLRALAILDELRHPKAVQLRDRLGAWPPRPASRLPNRYHGATAPDESRAVALVPTLTFSSPAEEGTDPCPFINPAR